jgi:hypothetical protein
LGRTFEKLSSKTQLGLPLGLFGEICSESQSLVILIVFAYQLNAVFFISVRNIQLLPYFSLPVPHQLVSGTSFQLSVLHLLVLLMSHFSHQ